jgi:CubicO group peptidase (beta-lactamase class C family)
MKRVFFVLLLALVACTNDNDPIAQIESAILPRFAIEGETIEAISLAERMKAENVHAITIAVAIDGKLAWARAYGLADKDKNSPATPETLFQAASLSKPVAAMAALKLVEDGVLDLDTNVNKDLKGWKLPENAFTAERKVTLRSLLTHTAGTNVSSFPGYAQSETVPTTLEVLKGEGNTDAIRVMENPGEGWRYSGGGYTILQKVMTDVTDKSFPVLMEETVLAPLGMSDSTFEQPLPERFHAQAAAGHRARGRRVEGDWHVYPEMAAAGLWTTPTDLVKFFLEIQESSLGEGKILSQSMAREMLEPGMNNWGLGPVIQGDGKRFGHGGSNAGFRSQFTAFIDGGSGAVVMTNSDSGGRLAFDTLLTIANAYGWAGMELETKRTKALEPAQYEALAGIYELEELDGAIISYVNGKLRAARGGLSSVPREILAESETKFFYRDDGTPVEFVLENGEATSILIRDTIRGHKTP